MSLTTRVSRGFVVPFDREFAFLNRVVNGVQGFDGSPAAEPVRYGVDVREDGDKLVFEVELPGYTKDQVDLTVEDQVLTIAADRRQDKSQQPGTFLVSERQYGQFTRSFKLPPTADEKSVQARLENGVLTVTLGRREETKPRKVVVS